MWFKSFFNKALRAFKALLKIALPIAKQIAIAMLIDMAREHVRIQEANPNSGKDKSEAVFKVLKNFAETNRIEVDGNDIELAIKLAVSEMRNK